MTIRDPDCSSLTLCGDGLEYIAVPHVVISHGVTVLGRTQQVGHRVLDQGQRELTVQCVGHLLELTLVVGDWCRKMDTRVGLGLCQTHTVAVRDVKMYL